MKASKFLLAAILSVVLAFSVVACTGSGNGSTQESEPESQSTSVTESVVESEPESESESESQPEEDTTAPKINFAEGKVDNYTVVAGQTLLLPAATAIDDKDGEVEIEVSVTTRGATVTPVEEGYQFASETAGEYEISYYAADAAENETETFIFVTVTPVVDETVLADGEDDIDNLTKSLQYTENFAKGYSGALAKGFSYSTAAGEPHASVKSTSDSVAGNSLFIDYSSCAWNTNTGFWFGTLDNYIKSGKWTIAMDIKVVSGTAPSGIYFSFIYDGDNSGENQQFALGGTGEVKHVEFTTNKTFDENKTWHFRIFFYTGDSSYSYDNFVIAIDNISFTIKEVVTDTVNRTGTPKTVSIEEASAENGYTLTGADDNYTSLNGSALYLDKTKVVASERLTEQQAAYLTTENGFNSQYIIEATTQIITFGALKNLCTDSGYTFTVTMKVYGENSVGWHIFFTDGAGNQAGAWQMATVNGTATFTHSFTGAENYVNIGLYNGSISPIYIGDITVKAEVRQDTSSTPNGYKVGKIWSKAASELNLGNKGQSVTCSDVTIGGSALNTYAGFENSAIYFNTSAANQTLELFRGAGTMENGCTYKITVCVYVVECTGRLMINIDNNVFLDIVANKTGYQNVTIEWKATKDVDFFSLYLPDSTGKVYLASVSYELTKIA